MDNIKESIPGYNFAEDKSTELLVVLKELLDRVNKISESLEITANYSARTNKFLERALCVDTQE